MIRTFDDAFGHHGMGRMSSLPAQTRRKWLNGLTNSECDGFELRP